MKIRFAAILLIAVFAAWGQKGGGGATGGSGGGASAGSGVGMGPSTAPSRTGSNPMTTPNSAPGIPTPIFLSGKVMMADGLPLPPGIAIQRICQGLPRTVGYTDSHGNFSFQWGDYAGITPDASEPGSMGLGGGSAGGLSATTAGGSQVMNRTSTAGTSQGGMSQGGLGGSIGACELRANLAGYTSDSVSLFTHRAMDNPDVGRIVLHRNTAVQGLAVSATSFEAPKDARKAYDRALASLHKGKQADAGNYFEKAVEIYPRYADAWVELGRLRLAGQQTEPARDAFRKAMSADAKLVAPYMELGLISAREQNWQDSAGYLDKGLQLDPVDFPQAWYVDAVANFNLKKLEPAEKSAREAVKLDPRHQNPRADYLLGLVLMEKRDYAGAATELKNYLAMAPTADNHEEVRKQLEQLEKSQAPPQP
ncbi:MAG TPA: tetratricopeptide repeat protein [Bryobacteraceae bacterium]|nr:tetratricopeptide repeat protein [Bryobacteraceae bacterium]